MRFTSSSAVLTTFLLTACTLTDRPQVLQAGPDDEVVTLPGGGALLVRRAFQPAQCMVRSSRTRSRPASAILTHPPHAPAPFGRGAMHEPRRPARRTVKAGRIVAQRRFPRRLSLKIRPARTILVPMDCDKARLVNVR